MALAITLGAAVSGRLASPLRAIHLGAAGMLASSLLLALVFSFDTSLFPTLICYVFVLTSLGLTLPAAMTAALTLHRARAGFAAAILGSVTFIGGGIIAPFTAMGDARLCVSIIFIASSFLLVLVSFWLSRRMKLEDAQGTAIPLNLDISSGLGAPISDAQLRIDLI